MLDRRVCACHGEPMKWSKSGRYKAGGYWRCAVKARASDRRYGTSEKGRPTRVRNNPRRIFVGGTYIGTENTFPAPREAVAQFARELIERHRKELP